MDDCFPTIPRQSCASPPPQTGAGAQALSLHSCSLQVGRSQGPALALAGLWVPCQQGGFGSQFLIVGSLGPGPQLLHVPPSVGTTPKETTLGHVACALYTRSSVSSAPCTRQRQAQVPCPQNSPPRPQVPLGIYFLLARMHLVLRGGPRKFGDLGLVMPWTVDGECAVIYFVYSVCKGILCTQ